jgi:hypothetical protein
LLGAADVPGPDFVPLEVSLQQRQGTYVSLPGP